MKVAIVGSRTLVVNNLCDYLPDGTTEIVSGGARGIDECAAEYAKKMGIAFTEIKPDYNRYKKGAPLVRNKEIVEMSDFVLVFWDGESRGTKYVIDMCERIGKEREVYIIKT